jgi:hypothetical protein
VLHLAVPRSHLAELHDVVRTSHRARTVCAIQNSDHRTLYSGTRWFLDGQVELDSTAAVTRSATCSLLDPDGRAGLDSTAPLDGALGLDRYLHLRREYWLPHAQEWVSVPMFTGPISGVTRSGPVIDVEAQGKELLALQPAWAPKTWRKGARRIDIIEELMRDRAGEWAFHLPKGWGARIGRDWSIVRRVGDEQHTIWARAQVQAKSLGDKQLFYDARGILRARTQPVKPVWEIREEDLADRPTVSERTSEVVNTVVFTGGVPKGGKSPVTATASLPWSHPWSPSALGRRGVGRYLPVAVEDSSVVTQKDADAAAQRALKVHERGSVELSATALPIPWLEPRDLLTVPVAGVPTLTRLHKATYSLTGDLMSIGHLRTYRPRRRSRR